VDHIDVFLHELFSTYGVAAEAIVELALAGLCGGLVGLERELRGRQAGFRTNLLVCVGSALVMIVSNHVARIGWPHDPNVTITVDPARIAYGVMGGIGFLGAGTIVKSSNSVRGLTTAAGLWCVAALGLAAGLGMYTLTVAATLIVLFTLWFLEYFAKLLPSVHFRAITVRCRWEPGCVGRVVDWLKGFDFKVLDVHFSRTGDLTHVDVDARVSFARKKMLYHLERRSQAEQDFELLAVQEA
jgi:putative Mg2+ transporter-C (MgtC) family protein